MCLSLSRYWDYVEYEKCDSWLHELAHYGKERASGDK